MGSRLQRRPDDSGNLPRPDAYTSIFGFSEDLSMTRVAVLPPLRTTVRIALMRIAAYEKISTPQLIEAARALPGGTKVHIPGSPHRDCSPSGSPAFRSELGQNLPADNVRRANVALRVTNGYVLNDGASTAVGRIRPHDGALLGEYGVHFTYDLTGIISDQH